MKSFLVNKIMWVSIAILAFISATAGVLNPNIYSKVMDKSLIPGTMAQDFLTILVTLGLLVLILKTKEKDIKKQLIIIGIIGSLGYLYAIFSIERIYNWYYLIYLAILGLSLYSIPISISSLDKKEKWIEPGFLKWTSILFSGFIGILFLFLWITSLIPIMRTGQKIELYYSIYILDLAWVMPGFLITAIMNIKNKSASLLLTPVMYILGIFVIFPLGLGEIAKPFYGINSDIKGMTMSFVLSGLFLVMAVAQLSLLKINKKNR